MSQNKYPLHLATRLGDLDEVQRLIEGGAIINDVGSMGDYYMGVLHIAAESKRMAIAKYLLAHGADVNDIKNLEKKSPLHYATENSDLEMIRLFTESGANMQWSNIYGDMPIHVAAKQGDIEIIKYFVQKGIDADITNTVDNITPLQLAAHGGYLELVDYLLLNNANVNFIDGLNQNSMHYAVHGRNAKIVQRLIEKGVDVNIVDFEDLTPLHLACRKGHLEIVQLLLENGAVDSLGLEEGILNYSPLHLAIDMGHLEIVKYVISRGVDVDFGSSQGYTLLHAACIRGRIEIVKFLLENGAKVNKKTTKKPTPLYFAIIYKWPKIVELLILNGADLKQAEYKGNCPLSITLKNMSELERTKCMALAKVIIKYTVLFYNPSETIIQDGFRFFQELWQYYSDCQNEITNMMSMIIKNSTVSLYQIICDSNKSNAFVKYLFNDNIKNELQNIEDYLKYLSIYGNINPLVQLRVKEGLQRIGLLTKADLIMKKIAPHLPSEIRYTILEYLNMTDLKTVIKLDLSK